MTHVYHVSTTGDYFSRADCEFINVAVNVSFRCDDLYQCPEADGL